MTRILTFASGKGGVGKTMIVSNLATALNRFGEKVLALDANLTTPNLALHLGMPLVPYTLHDVLKGTCKLKNAIYSHPLGFQLLPASLNLDDLKGVDPARLVDITLEVSGKYDFVLLDCAAGLGREALSAIQAADEVIAVTSLDSPSLVDVLKMMKLAKKLNKKVTGVVINRVKKRSKLSEEYIGKFLEVPILAKIPEDSKCLESIEARIPLIDYSPYSDASIELLKLAAKLCNKTFFPPRRRLGFFKRFLNWLST